MVFASDSLYSSFLTANREFRQGLSERTLRRTSAMEDRRKERKERIDFAQW